MISPRQGTRYRAGAITTQPVGNQPFLCFSNFKFPVCLPAKFYLHMFLFWAEEARLPVTFATRPSSIKVSILLCSNIFKGRFFLPGAIARGFCAGRVRANGGPEQPFAVRLCRHKE